MGYMLEFYCLDWEELGEKRGCKNKELLDNILEEEGQELDLSPDEQQEYEEALENILMGDKDKRLEIKKQVAEPADQSKIEEVSDGEAMAIVSLVRHIGERIGEMSHSSAGGEEFRETFLAVEAKKALNTSVDLLLLTDRPLFGFQSSSYPSWGGLKKSELKEVLGDITVETLPDLDDSDAEAWLYELVDYLTYASESNKDIITLYL
ncbi:MAG: hypothetical protein ABH886_00830 [Candidatus Desantisbacteria bacterium]